MQTYMPVARVTTLYTAYLIYTTPDLAYPWWQAQHKEIQVTACLTESAQGWKTSRTWRLSAAWDEAGSECDVSTTNHWNVLEYDTLSSALTRVQKCWTDRTVSPPSWANVADQATHCTVTFSINQSINHLLLNKTQRTITAVCLQQKVYMSKTCQAHLSTYASL